MNKDCPDAKPDCLPDDADDELRATFADADSMAHSGYTREQIWSSTGIDYGPTPNGDSPAAAEYMTREMMAGLGESDELENRAYKRSSDGRFASTGAGQNNPRHKRASSGNPRAKRNKTNIPANLPPNATDGELERRLRKDMDNASAHKGNQITKRGNRTYSTTQKRMDHVREHVDEYLKTHPEKRGGFDTQKMNARAAKVMAQADFDADGKDAIAYGDGLKVVKSKNPKTGETEITTIYPEGKYRKQNK